MGDVVNEDAYISLTDIAKYKNPDNAFIVVANWMRNHSTISFLGLWEQIHNPNFKPIEFDRFKAESGDNAFTLIPQQWIKATDELPIIIAYPGYSKIGAPSELNSMWTKSLAERIKNERAHCIHIPFKKEPIFDAINQFSVVNSKYPKGGALGCYSEEAYKSWGIV